MYEPKMISASASKTIILLKLSASFIFIFPETSNKYYVFPHEIYLLNSRDFQ